MASIPSLSDPSPPLDLTPASRYSRGKYYDSKEEQNNDHDIDDYDCDSDTNNDNDDEEPEQEQAPPEIKATYQNASDRHVDGGGDENEDKNTGSTKINSVQKAPLPRRWIYDRVDGAVARHIRTKNEEGEKKKNKTTNIPKWKQHGPPCFLCYPSPLLKVFPWLLEEIVSVYL